MNIQLFRPQAVANHELGWDDGPQLDLADRPTRWGFRLVLVALVLVGIAAVTVHATESAEGTAVVQPGGRTALVGLPYGALSELRSGLPVLLRLDSGGEVAGEITSVGGVVLTNHDARGKGRAVVAVDVRLTTNAALPIGLHGVATVRLARSPVITLLLPGLRRLMGSTDV
jgi:hypothetical protein